MIFLTAGTQFAFDRLVRTIDSAAAAGCVREPIFAQIGESSYKPAAFEFTRFLSKRDFDEMFAKASAVVSHAGMGTISMALEHGKAMLAMPRLKAYGEVVNDHQVPIARQFSQAGYILAAFDETELEGKISLLPAFVPCKRQSHPESVSHRVSLFLHELGVLQT